MLVVVSELFSADSTNDMVRSRFGFLKKLGMFLLRGEFFGLSSKIVKIFLIKKSLILLCKFSLFL